MGPIIACNKMAFAKPDEEKNEKYGRDDRPTPAWCEILLKCGVDFSALIDGGDHQRMGGRSQDGCEFSTLMWFVKCNFTFGVTFTSHYLLG